VLRFFAEPMSYQTRTHIPVAFDMETRDPDDVLALCLLATHPAIELAAVTVTPGTRQQLGLVRTILELCERKVPIGARNPASAAAAVSQFHQDWLGKLPESDPDARAYDLLAAQFMAVPETVLLTGAPLHNLRLLLLNHPRVQISRWVAQGGFAGEPLSPLEYQLSKFAGQTARESFNFGGDKKATLSALASSNIACRQLVSKNVTHGVAWDALFQSRVKRATGLTNGAQLACKAIPAATSRRQASA